MTVYIIKTMLCSALLFAVYKLLFEGEKMHVFNRFYLIFCVVFSIAVPFINISKAVPSVAAYDYELIALQTPPFEYTTSHQIKKELLLNARLYAPLIVYITATLFFLFRFIKKLRIVFKRVKYYRNVHCNGATLVLTTDKLLPHSFLNYIFINEKAYVEGAIEKEILQHELAHVRQKHSLDILFMELLMVFVWMNPVLYFFKKAIQLNHEFLADDHVNKMYGNTKEYQYLLLNIAGGQQSLPVTSQFNYSITKKRLIMMTKNTSSRMFALKFAALIPLLSASVFIFSTKATAQEPVKMFVLPKQQIEFSKEDASPELMKEYEMIVNKYKTNEKYWWGQALRKLTVEEKKRLETIYKMMSKEQQAKQHVAFVGPSLPLERKTPTREEFELWKNAKVYGLWLNDKKVNNEILNNYTNADFATFWISKLSKNAINYGKHYYQVDVMTNEYYQKYYDEKIANKENRLIYRTWRKKEETK